MVLRVPIQKRWFVVILGLIGRTVLFRVGRLGRLILFLLNALIRIPHRPLRIKSFILHTRDIGQRSLMLIALTSSFAGMVLAMQGYNALVRFGSESFVGPLVALSLLRELGPVLAALMVSARAGSAMAATLGNMRITEQIDAIRSMAVDPIQSLVSPRLLATIVSLPLLTVLFDVFGLFAAYLFGTRVLRLDGGAFIGNVREAVRWQDVESGIYKSLIFACLTGCISTYHGYYTEGGSSGVGQATRNAVVQISASILIGDYIMTALLL